MTSILRRATEYPYSRPRGDFVFSLSGERVVPLDDFRAPELFADRQPVLAIGSNAAPEQLARKFSGIGDAVVPVTAVVLHEHDVVYAAMVASYGAVPATFTESPGTAARVHVTWLDDDQLDQMNRTESLGTAYELVEVPSRFIEARARPERVVVAYRALPGPLRRRGSAVALSSVEATGRRSPALSESQLLAEVAEAWGLSIGSLVEKLVADPGFFREVSAWLSAGIE